MSFPVLFLVCHKLTIQEWFTMRYYMGQMFMFLFAHGNIIWFAINDMFAFCISYGSLLFT